ncbi:MAG TPA: UDP-N-acetylmuramoyl-L-alanine--D-glutamate ligase [Saprospiraceae bacterium]|nr:UDP-N-acetylmuramoyl-L-alanine--D-glutamate ligase [Saprospiraceae bacterium]HRG64771.1 UDP-N-acetylmuramoyl-L-alanine--D-glutamate ligase [Saprospiraceae bacterium]
MIEGLTDKKILIIGSGESGTGAAVLAKKLNYDVLVSDGSIIPDKYKEVLDINKIPYEEGGHHIDSLSNVGLVLKSPGVPEGSMVMQTIRRAGLRVISEIEFAALHYKGTMIAITGSNGKTTTSGLLYHLLNAAGLKAGLAGNYGDSFAGYVAGSPDDVVVLEVSSFQLDDIDSFKPHISILLNITPDHLDRYDYKMENYVASKFRVNQNQDNDDYFIINGDDEEMLKYRGQHTLNGKVIEIKADDYLDGVRDLRGNNFELTIKGRHNRFNARCAVETCRLMGISEEKIAHGLATFRNLAHRLEPVATVNGVEYINDSKATNVDSVYYALEAMDKPVVWIAGGTDKGNDYSAIDSLVREKVKALVCMGVDNTKLVAAFKGKVAQMVETNSIKDAVMKAGQLAEDGDIVLLSPACASFDLFKNYMDRGDQFKQMVLSL